MYSKPKSYRPCQLWVTAQLQILHHTDEARIVLRQLSVVALAGSPFRVRIVSLAIGHTLVRTFLFCHMHGMCRSVSWQLDLQTPFADCGDKNVVLWFSTQTVWLPIIFFPKKCFFLWLCCASHVLLWQLRVTPCMYYFNGLVFILFIWNVVVIWWRLCFLVPSKHYTTQSGSLKCTTL